MNGKIVSKELVGNEDFSLRWLRISNEHNGLRYEKMKKVIVKEPMVRLI
jgi:hypothetical protein